MIRVALLLSVLFANGFEARAACQPATTLDLGDGLKPVLLIAGSSVCVDAGNATAKCQRDALGVCKREASPLPPIPPEPVCHPTPAGFTVIEKPWQTLMGAPYPNSPSWQQPIGSWTERTSYNPGGQPAAGRLYTAKFTADGERHKIAWLGAQAVSVAGYRTAQVALQAYVAVSPCRGDAYSGCKVVAKSSSLFYSPDAIVSACRVTPGQTYWLTVGHFPANLDPKKNTCSPLNPSGGVRCDSNFEAQ